MHITGIYDSRLYYIKEVKPGSLISSNLKTVKFMMSQQFHQKSMQVIGLIHILSCSSPGVQQVTWQKLSEDAPIQNLATYSKQFGQQVNSPFQDKVFFTKAALGSSSITLKNVTWDDDSCYICSFNAFPSGSKQQQTCLEVQGNCLDFLSESPSNCQG